MAARATAAMGATAVGGSSRALIAAFVAPPAAARPRRCPPPRRYVASASSEAPTQAATPSASGSAPGPRPPSQPDDLHPPHFADLPLDRSGGLRREEARLEALLQSPTSCVLLLHSHKLLVAPAAGAPSDVAVPGLALRARSFAAAGAQVPDGGEPRWLPLVAGTQQLLAAMPTGLQQQADFLFLGLDANGAAVFAATAPQHLLRMLPPVPPPRGRGSGGQQQPEAASPPPAAATDEAAGPSAVPPAPAAGCWVDVRREGQRMTGPDAAVAALAAGLVQWHGTAVFCSRTGAKTHISSGGHSRTPEAAPDSGRRPRSVYPRIDPAVIVAVGCGDWLLLGRKASWDAGRYSCLAGFAEVGETLEQAVGREVMEESGVAVDLGTAQYRGSQPWPFPQSLMIGFSVEAALTGGGAHPAGNKAPPPPRRGLMLLSGPAAMAAREVGLLPAEAERHLLPHLPDVQVDPRELQDARWFHLDWLAAAAAGRPPPPASRGAQPGPDFRIPGRHALANRIISAWVRQRLAQSGGGTMAAGGDSAGAAALAAVPDVWIDEGSFKYVLLRLSTPDGLHSKLLVRGDSRAAYHNHVLQATAAEVRAAAPDAGLVLGTVGGGRIEHYPEQRALSVFGFSSAFGQAPHDVTAAMLRRALPLHDIHISYQGY